MGVSSLQRSLLLTAVVSFMACYGYKSFQELIPNGNRVPNQCTKDPTDIWTRVGHAIEYPKRLFSPKAKQRNVNNDFGVDLLSAKKTWVDLDAIWPKLCTLDSDSDNRTNGQELGDPDCLWRRGLDNPGDGTGLTHPGIFDEIDGYISKKTRNKHCQKSKKQIYKHITF